MLTDEESLYLITKLHLAEQNRPGPSRKRWFTLEARLARKLVTAYLRTYKPELVRFLDWDTYAEGWDFTELRKKARQNA
jgi:hypothetical protein